MTVERPVGVSKQIVRRERKTNFRRIRERNRAFSWRICSGSVTLFLLYSLLILTEGVEQIYEERDQSEVGVALLGDVVAHTGRQQRPEHVREGE